MNYSNRLIFRKVDRAKYTSSSTHLGIDAALTYLTATDEVKAEVDAKLDDGETVTQKEIAELKRRIDAEAKEALTEESK